MADVKLAQLAAAFADKKDGINFYNGLKSLFTRMNCCPLSAPGLTPGSSDTAAIKVANRTQVLINGKVFTLEAAEIVTSGRSISNVADGAYMLVALDVYASTNMIDLVPSFVEGAATASTGKFSDQGFPLFQKDRARLGYMSIHASGSVFTLGTTAMSAGSSGYVRCFDAGIHDFELKSGTTSANS